MPAGRPTKYEPRFCDEVVEAGREGLSLTAFAGMIDVARSTIHEWMANFPEFSDATKRHATARTLVLERGLLKAENGPQVTSRIFALKNAAPEEWRDRQQIEHTGKDGGPIESEDVTARDALRSRIASLRARSDNGAGDKEPE